MTTFRVCIAGRNHEAYTEQCIESVLGQEGDVVIDWTDDASNTSDAIAIAAKTVEHTYRAPKEEHRLMANLGRLGGIENLWRAALRAKEDDVCVILGGDDWLEPGAIARIAKEYEDPECWMTYGTYRNDDGSPPVCSKWDGSDPRDLMFLWAPLTVRGALIRKVLEDDLKIGGWFLPSSGDVGLTLPLVEMAGPERCRYIEDIWFVRRMHAQNDHALDRRLQDFCSWMAYAKPRYSKLASLEDAPVRTPHLLRRSMLFAPQYMHGMNVAY